MAGRPSIYSEELADQILERIRSGESLTNITDDDDMPCMATVMFWLDATRPNLHKPLFLERYTHAMEVRQARIFDEVLKIADDDTLDIGFSKDGKPFVNGENIQRSRLRCDMRLKYLEKMNPKKYGAQQRQVHEGDKENPVALTIKWQDSQ